MFNRSHDIHPLRRWLVEQGISADQFARLVGLRGRAAVHRIMRVGTCSPRTAARIELATNGAVTALEVLFGNRQRWRLVEAPERQSFAVEAVEAVG